MLMVRNGKRVDDFGRREAWFLAEQLLQLEGVRQVPVL